MLARALGALVGTLVVAAMGLDTTLHWFRRPGYALRYRTLFYLIALAGLVLLDIRAIRGQTPKPHGWPSLVAWLGLGWFAGAVSAALTGLLAPGGLARWTDLNTCGMDIAGVLLLPIATSAWLGGLVSGVAGAVLEHVYARHHANRAGSTAPVQ